MPTLPASAWPAVLLLATASLMLLGAQRRSGLLLLGASLPAALWGSWLSLPALPPLLLAAALLQWQQVRASTPVLAILWLLALALGLHLLPGFTGITLWQGRLAPDSSLLLLRWSLDKALGGCLLLLLYAEWQPRPCGQRWPQLALAALLLALAVAAALLLGLVHIDVKWPAWWPFWLIGNLLFTCLAEEALFRRALPQLLPASWTPLARMLVCSLLFGLAHAAGGSLWVLCASLAGMAYALVYRAGGRLGWAILAHVGFNSLHLALLSYPQLQ
ncbi:CPBP family intramembrane glutamic endopeptidase [Vogesella sp. LIG4]|uniref:CPBP family intramembrane glutamic endopeptidase n=1 Tax=Vogesella sp. LIG4 TaxID=1192162 RepID=UPI0008200FB6|nr:CPBP family intramembrane glutamic endopeptidase [Vogesella sp. LIG4]SCK10813.1 hypothetical protein PSELUDRAFT_0852 [Vogesella sp. LIG4]